MKAFTRLVLAANLLSASLAFGATITVSNLGDSGPGSLRQAILDANASGGADTINFNIPGAGVQTITPLTQLPDITGPVSIDGYSQPGSSANTLSNSDNAEILIRLDGVKLTNGFPVALKFVAGSSGSSVRGLIIVRFSNAIYANEISNLTIAGNWVGMDFDGIARGTTFEAIFITSFISQANNVVIGGTSPADRNVISGNSYGISLNGDTTANCLVQGNFIGTDPTGTLPRGNVFGGVFLFGATNITIGGAAAGAGNVISGSTAGGGTGITVQGGGGALIQNNLIGTDVSGQYDLGNVSDGIFITGSEGNHVTGNEIVNNGGNGLNISSSSGTIVENNCVGTDSSLTRPLGNALAGIAVSGSTNRVGGLSPGQPNTIQFNGGAGVDLTFGSPVQDEISANRIHDNGGLGIDLGPPGVTANDLSDPDTGANNLQNYPVLTNASIAFSALNASGTFNSQSGRIYRLEFFASPNWDPSGIAEGQVFLGSTNISTDSGGNANFSVSFSTAPPTNFVVTATATDTDGNTSEFSAGLAVTVIGEASPFLEIISSGGSGGGGTTTVSWPSAASFFGLEETDSLSPPIQWQAVTEGIVDSGTIKSFALTNSGGSNAFFRLRKN